MRAGDRRTKAVAAGVAERDEPPGEGAPPWRIEDQPLHKRIIQAFRLFANWATAAVRPVRNEPPRGPRNTNRPSGP
jgi:hypothetical protein